MRSLLKRWRLVEEEFEVAGVPEDSDVASAAASALLEADPRPDRAKAVYAGVVSLEGDLWTVHDEEGIVFLSGENGAVQVQFDAHGAYELGVLLAESGARIGKT